MFKLKAAIGGALMPRWLALNPAGRRKMLMGEIASVPLAAIDGKRFADGIPKAIDTIEWFASPADLARTMDWLRRNSEQGPGAEARAILSRNSGIGPAASARWNYVGYKGGSEPGLINMTLLLQAKSGNWFVVTAGWSNTAAPVDEARFVSLVTRAVELAAMPTETRPAP